MMGRRQYKMTAMLKSDFQLYLRLLAYLGPYKLLFPLSLLGFLMVAAGNMLTAELFKYLELAFNDAESPWRWRAPLALVAVALLLGMGNFIGSFTMDYLGRRVIHSLRSHLFDHLLRLPKTFYDKSSGGKLISQLVFNVEQVAESTTLGLTSLLRDGLTVCTLLGYLFYQSWRLTLVQVLVLPVLVLLIFTAGKYLRKYSRKIQDSVGDVAKVAGEAFAGFGVIRIYNGVRYEQQRFRAISRHNFRQNLKFRFVNRITGPIINVSTAIAFATIVWLTFNTSLQQDFASIGAFVSYITAIGLLVAPLKSLSQVNAVFQKALAAAEKIFANIDAQPEPDSGTRSLPRVAGSLQLVDLSFNYGADDSVLHQLNLSIEARSSVAIVGRSGSGKSTLVQLVQRFYDPDQGQILLDGVDIRELKVAELRRHIASVEQQVFLFNDSIYNNLSYANPSIDRAAAELALQRAHALEFVEQLPEGMDTVVGDSGQSLSGGQLQRLALARAFAKDAAILILDEATSALDNESEAYIQQALAEIRQRCTSIVIAHRLSTVENADKIIVLDRGKIVDVGSHSELIARAGLYQSLYKQEFDA